MKKKGLGRGLSALLPSISEDDVKSSDESIFTLNINEINTNLEQPRKKFDDKKLKELSESIKRYGVIQPIIVKKEDGVYRIVAGERRWRAARMAGLKDIPVVIKDLTKKEVMEVALIENIQREDLNPIEEAEAYERLIKEYKLTQEELSETVGKNRSTIANSMRLLALHEDVKNYLMNGDITSGHARALLVIQDTNLQCEVANEIIQKELTVREVEKLVKLYQSDKKEVVKEEKVNDQIIEYKSIEEKLKNFFGTKVTIKDKKQKGIIVIEYYSVDELDRIVEMIDIKE